jgi:hypothetical protein
MRHACDMDSIGGMPQWSTLAWAVLELIRITGCSREQAEAELQADVIEGYRKAIGIAHGSAVEEIPPAWFAAATIADAYSYNGLYHGEVLLDSRKSTLLRWDRTRYVPAFLDIRMSAVARPPAIRLSAPPGPKPGKAAAKARIGELADAYVSNFENKHGWKAALARKIHEQLIIEGWAYDAKSVERILREIEFTHPDYAPAKQPQARKRIRKRTASGK